MTHFFCLCFIRDWKHRSKPNKKKPYVIRIYRNYLDPRFCPVLWLLKWLVFSGIKSGPKEDIGEDGIRRMWVWKPVSVAGFDGRDQL